MSPNLKSKNLKFFSKFPPRSSVSKHNTRHCRDIGLNLQKMISLLSLEGLE